MASIYIIATFSLILLLLPIWSTASNALPPIFSPIAENACKEMNCGKGTCKASSNATFGFACECEPGWRQTRSENDNLFKFLPCVIPNCTMNFSCGEKETPAPAPDKRSNSSIFEPCRWADCGGGSCNKTSSLTYSCDCQEGYHNLLNQTAFPCFKECALGMDCAQLGIDVMNNNSSPPPSLPDIENACKEMNCGKGTCKASSNSTFGFTCECKPGWTQTRLENDNFFKFLPCVVPNCTMNFSCGEKEAPTPAPDKRSNSSIFEPCHWANCGGGSCNKTSPMTYSCDCQEGYYNLLNQTAFPCFKTCALGMDCAQLGIDVMNNNSSPPPSLPDNSKSIAISFFGGGYGWLIITVASMAAVLLI